MYSAFVGAKIGSQVAYAVPGHSGRGRQPPPPPSRRSRPSWWSYQIESAKDAPKLLAKDDVDKLDKAGSLPTVKFNAKGVPSINIPKKDAPTDLVVQVLTEGTGDVLKETDSITANYTGWQWADGKKFDSSFDRASRSTSRCSRSSRAGPRAWPARRWAPSVLLVIPSSLAYGDSAASGQPGPALVFVVDILGKK